MPFELDPNLMKMFLERRRADELQRMQFVREQEEKRETSLDTARRLAMTQAKDPESSFQKTAEFLRRNSNSPADHLLVDALEAEYKKAGKAAKTQAAQSGLATDRAAGIASGGQLPFDPSKIVPGQQQNLTQNVPGMGRGAVIQNFREIEANRGMPGLREENQAAILQRLQAGGKTPEQLGQVAVGSQAERDYSWLRERKLITPKQEGEMRYAARIRDAYGSRDTLTNVNIPVQLMNEIAQDVREYRDGLEIVDRAVFLIDQDPTRAGFGARVRNFIDRGYSRLEALGQVLGPKYQGVLSSTQADLISVLQSGEFSESEADAEVTNNFMHIVTDEGVAELELLGLLLAFKHERSLTGGRRFSIQAVDKLRKALNLHDPRGPGVVRRRLMVTRSMFKKKFDDGTADMARLNKMFRGEVGEESIFGDMGAPLDLGGTGAVAPSVYEYDEKGNLRRIR